MDWKLKLFQILDAIGEEEGTVFERSWCCHGITREERDQIILEYETHETHWRESTPDIKH
jgi:hypothetical protein